ncbi:MAG: exo-alpha-sialidase [Verrucomicrobia bacterium]|nr:exo-alpha-sialidase [Verrucomicrobiota bacterium]
MKHTFTLLTALLLAPLAALHGADNNKGYVSDKVIANPGAESEDNARTWQGIPGIERAPNGRLWATWYTGGLHEGAAGNYVAVATSGDDGKTWSKPVVLIKGHTEHVMLADPLPWVDPKGRLWIFYLHAPKQKGASGFVGACAVRNDSPNDAVGEWSQPVPVQPGGRIFGKPIVLASGGWLAPFFKNSSSKTPEVKETCTLISTDEGATWTFHGGTSVPLDIRNFSEATLAQRKNGDLWMVIRTLPGLHHSTSKDGGRTWSDPVLLREGPNTRACMMRLASGAFLLVYHDVERPKPGAKFPRNRLAAWLSDDEGRSWPHKLVVDDQKGVSYPDCIQSPDGRIYIAYDQWRYGGPDHNVKDILLAVIREGDIRAGRIASPDARIHQLINRATGIGNIKELEAQSRAKTQMKKPTK